MARRSGFTLVETLLAIVIVSVLTLMAYPKVSSAMIQNGLRGGRTRLVNMLAGARAAATQGGRRAAYVRFNGDVAVLTAAPRTKAPIGVNTEDTLIAPVNLKTLYGATLTTNGTAAIAYDPRGFASGFDKTVGAKIELTHGSYSQYFVVDQLGRVAK